ncbi:MAG: tRNA preQ1(34) S-adenosylmethionine ribosyltransferase-isomerase QueA [Verrucomicrobia bacterium]|nr:tRNA preQ1(34) S-adenosylmethionine ribosyltransferase-isomerase QueA [Verrucomicrobiota bacterium]
MRTADFHYALPPELIAQDPAAERDQSRLLVLHRRDGRLEHRSFRELPAYLRPGDALVLNNSRVIPARLRARKSDGGGQVELLLLAENGANDWWCLARPAKRLRPNSRLRLLADGRPTEFEATVLEKNAEGHCRLRFASPTNLLEHLNRLGEAPLPPYITRTAGTAVAQDRERYQTVFAQPPGSVAAPTAGLHFTHPLLDEVRARGARVCFVTLHVGLGTFAPVRTANLEDHRMHEERFELDAATAATLDETRRAGGRIIAVGTTTVRVLETAARAHRGLLAATGGRTRIFIYPPFEFQVVGGLVTNFHLPESTLLMLVSAFASPGESHGREWVLAAYRQAVRERYRFYSYGDAMLLL